VVFCTFAGVNFRAESAPESRNLHRKFRKFSVFFFWGWYTRTGPLLQEVATHAAPTPSPRTAVWAMREGKRRRCWDTDCDTVGRGASHVLTTWGGNPTFTFISTWACFVKACSQLLLRCFQTHNRWQFGVVVTRSSRSTRLTYAEPG